MNNKTKHPSIHIIFILAATLLLFVGSCACKPVEPRDPYRLACASHHSPLVDKNPPAGGGISNIGNSCYMNAVIQILTRIYPQTFKNNSEPIAKPGQAIIDSLQAQKNVDDKLAQEFFNALKIYTQGKFVRFKQEDSCELLQALFDKLSFSKATTKSSLKPLIGPTNNNKLAHNLPQDDWNILQLCFSNESNSLQAHLDATLAEETIDDYIFEGSSNKQTIQKFKKIDNLDNLSNGILPISLNRFSAQGRAHASASSGATANNFTASKILNLVENPLKLTIKKDQITYGTQDIHYQLIGFIVHSGGLNSGHYMAYTKENEQWTEYNDSTVKKLSDKNAEDEAKKAYLYFYKANTLIHQ